MLKIIWPGWLQTRSCICSCCFLSSSPWKSRSLMQRSAFLKLLLASPSRRSSPFNSTENKKLKILVQYSLYSFYKKVGDMWCYCWRAIRSVWFCTIFLHILCFSLIVYDHSWSKRDTRNFESGFIVEPYHAGVAEPGGRVWELPYQYLGFSLVSAIICHTNIWKIY